MVRELQSFVRASHALLSSSRFSHSCCSAVYDWCPALGTSQVPFEWVARLHGNALPNLDSEKSAVVYTAHIPVSIA